LCERALRDEKTVFITPYPFPPQVSFFQKKQVKPGEEEDEKAKKKGKKKKWINLDAAGFEDYEGAISGDEEEEVKPGDKIGQFFANWATFGCSL
jgi:hypothetical protein